MERGKGGINHAAAAERLLLVTARSIEPPSPVDPSLVLPIGFKRCLWHRLMACNAEFLGLPAAIHLPHVACRELKIAHLPTSTSGIRRKKGRTTATSSPTRVGTESLSPMASSLASASGRSLAGALPEFRVSVGVLLRFSHGNQVLGDRAIDVPRLVDVLHRPVRFGA